VGGHCIPIDPSYLWYKVRTRGCPFRFVELAQEINGRMLGYVTGRAAALLNWRAQPVNGRACYCSGLPTSVTWPTSGNPRARPIARKLRTRGAVVSYHDPQVSEWQVNGQLASRAADLDRALADADLTILLQPHAVYDQAKRR
jgi:UDP-N-acetyl-D-mannosaminuronate dehydrogenase